ncbi:DUF1523 family protein [Epibacterium ulvae]|uniref:DUF1523 family protein n=1 Tax=Epibacterium ulvae TaxID=1156985 RepID=UPI002492587C|nr:DUF1523 family protein [Epibacterium ulvae]
MGYVRWIIFLMFWSGIAAVLHYTLPQYDVVRIVNTYEERIELNDWTRAFWSRPDAQSAAVQNRDVQFIQAVRPNGDAIVYRNEDTGWSWPPYFKFDTANLYTQANDAISTKDAPEWVAIRHYGWRSQFLTVFPNAVSLSDVAASEVKPRNWFNIIFLIGFSAVAWAVWVRWRRFRIRRVEPIVEHIEDDLWAAGNALRDRRNRLREWFRR